MPTPLPPPVLPARAAPCGETAAYLGGTAGVKISRLRPGSGFGFGLGAFFVSFLPLSLFPMRASMTQKPSPEKPQSNARLQRLRRPRRSVPDNLHLTPVRASGGAHQAASGPRSTGTGAPWRVTNRSGRQQALSSCVRSACISLSDANDANVASRIAAAPASAGRSMR